MPEIYEPIYPQTVEVELLTPDNAPWVIKWCKGWAIYGVGVEVPTLKGRIAAAFGMCVVKKRNGDFVVMTKEELDRSYRRKNGATS